MKTKEAQKALADLMSAWQEKQARSAASISAASREAMVAQIPAPGATSHPTWSSATKLGVRYGVAASTTKAAKHVGTL